MTDKKKEPEDGSLHGISFVLGIAGVVTTLGSLMMETTIEIGYGMSRETVHNLGLLQNQSMVFQAGLAAIIAAFILWGVDRLGR